MLITICTSKIKKIEIFKNKNKDIVFSCTMTKLISARDSKQCRGSSDSNDLLSSAEPP